MLIFASGNEKRVVAMQLYPGGGSVVKLMETLSDWLLSLPLQRIPYQAVLDLVNNKMRVRRTNGFTHVSSWSSSSPSVSSADCRRVFGGGATLGRLSGQQAGAPRLPMFPLDSVSCSDRAA